MTWHNRLLLSVLLALFTSLATAADFYVVGGLGTSFFQPTVPDGTWYQEAFPHKFSTLDRSMKVGAGLAFNKDWSIEASYLHLGSVVSTADFVLDADYNPAASACMKHCDKPHSLRATDTMQGGELLLRRSFEVGPLSPFLSAGLALVYHFNSVNVTTNGKKGNDVITFDGLMPMAVVGGGVCYAWVCAEAHYYKGFGTDGFPISREVIMPMVSVRVPL